MRVLLRERSNEHEPFVTYIRRTYVLGIRRGLASASRRLSGRPGRLRGGRVASGHLAAPSASPGEDQQPGGVGFGLLLLFHFSLIYPLLMVYYFVGYGCRV